MQGPLTGITVIDCSRAVAGPYTGMLLGDLGANVIKIEAPGDGDEGRGMTPTYGTDSCYFLLSNRNKRSITLDLKSPEGQRILQRLLVDADVFIENFKPQTAARLGVTYEAFRDKHPRLIHCSITGFGPTGPMSDRPAMDAMMQAYTGVMSVTGEPGRAPVRMGVAVSDLGAALHAAYGILAAVVARVSTGRGQKVETSLLESTIALSAYQNTSYWGTGKPPERLGSAHAAMAPLQVFEVADGYMLIMAGTQKQWLSLCEVLSLDELSSDPRFTTNALRVQHRDALHLLIGGMLLRHSRAEWLALFAGRDIQYSLVNNTAEALDEPQVLHQGMVIERPHPTLGTMKFTGFPVKLSDTPAGFRLDPPALGQHTEEILREIGCDTAEIAHLRESRAI